MPPYPLYIMGPIERVAIFWDYENCRPPSSLIGVTVADKILSVAQSFGGVTSFKAYLELSPDCLNPKGTLLHSELQSSGISITHCPHNGKKDVADKMMLVDMMAYAIDNPAPATIVIITGDRDFTYGVSILKLRGYKVVTIVPAASHSSMRTRASESHSWESVLDCVPRTPLSACPLPATPTTELTDIALQSPVHSDVPSTLKTPPKGGIKSPPAITTIFHGKTQSVYEARNQDAVVESLASYAELSTQIPPVREGLSKSPSSSKNPWTLSSPDISGGYSGTQCFLNDRPDHTSGLNAEEQEAREEEDSSASESFYSALENSSAFSSDTLASSTDILECDVLQHDDMISSTLQTAALAEPTFRDSWLSSQATIPSSVLGDQQDKRCEHLSEIETGCNFDGVLTTDSSQETLVDDKDSFLNGPSSPLQGTFQVLHQQSESLEATCTVPQDRPPPSANTPSTAVVGTNPQDGVAGPGSSGAFSLLVDILRRSSISDGTGKRKLQISQVGAELMKRDPHVYERAGVTKLKDYLAHAREANIIFATFDSQGCGWVELIDNSSGLGSSSRNTEKTTRAPVVVSKPAISKQKTGRRLDTDPFDMLIKCLRQFRKEGVSPASWSKVATDLQKRSSQPYKRAGVNKLKDYLFLAREAKIVNLGGLNTTSQWVELTPPFLAPVQ